MKKVDLIQFIIIGRIIFSISDITCCKHVQQYILSKKDADQNDRLKRGLIFLAPYKKNDIISNSNENSREKTFVELEKITDQKLNKNKQSLKIFLHFNKTFEKNQTISDNTKNSDKENHDDSYIQENPASGPKEIVKRIINFHNISKNNKNTRDKNPIKIMISQKANRSRRMSQNKYMCYCKETKCRCKQGLHEKIYDQHPWRKIYFPNIKEYMENRYDEEKLSNKSGESLINDYESIKTYVKNDIPTLTTLTEPTKFNIPFTNNENLEKRIMIENGSPEIKQQQHHPNIYYPNPLIKIKKNKPFSMYEYDPYTTLHHGIVYSGLMPTQINHPAITEPQIVQYNNYVPSTFGRNFPNVGECIRLYGHNVCLISTTVKPHINKIETINLSKTLSSKAYSNYRNNQISEHYANANHVPVKLLHSTEYDDITKLNSNLNSNNYSLEEIIKNENNANNIKQTSTFSTNDKPNDVIIKNRNSSNSLHALNIKNLYKNKSKSEDYVTNLTIKIPSQSNIIQQQITIQPPHSYNIQNANNIVESFKINNTFLDKNNDEIYNNDSIKDYEQSKNIAQPLMTLKDVQENDYKSNFNIQRASTLKTKENSIKNQLRIKSRNGVQQIHNDRKNISILPQILSFNYNNRVKEQFEKYNITASIYKNIDQVSLKNENIYNLTQILKNFKNNHRNKLMKLNMNQNKEMLQSSADNQQDIFKNMKLTRKPLYGQTRRSTTECDKKLIQLNNENKLSVQKLESSETFIQSFDKKSSIDSESISKDNFLNYKNDNVMDIISLSPNLATQTDNMKNKKKIIINKNKIIEPNTKFYNDQLNLETSTQKNFNEILLQNTIKKVINNFVPGKAQDLIANYDNESIQKFINANVEDIFPEILEIPILENIFAIPEVENMIVDSVKNILFGITNSPVNNVQIIKNVLHNIIQEIFLSRATITKTTTNEKQYENGNWVTEQVTFLKKLQNLTAVKYPSKKVFNKIQSIINKLSIAKQDTKQPVIQNLIIKTVKHSLDNESAAIDEATIRQAFEILIHPKTENSSNFVPPFYKENFSYTSKTPNIEMKKSLILQPKIIKTHYNKDYKRAPAIPITESTIQNSQWIKQQQNIVEKQQSQNLKFKENKTNLIQDNLGDMQLKKIKSKGLFPDNKNEQIQKYNLYTLNINEGSENVKLSPEELILLPTKNYTFLKKKIKNEYSGKSKSVESDDSIERKPIKYYSPSDRILEYFKNHQNSNNSKLKTMAEIIDYDNDNNINKTTHQIIEKISVVDHNSSKAYKNPINAFDYELSSLQSNPNQLENIKERENSKQQLIIRNSYEDEEQLFKNPKKLSTEGNQLNVLIESNNHFLSDSQTPIFNESNDKIKTKEIKHINNKLNDDQTLNISRTKFLNSLFENKYTTNSSISQDLMYFGKLVPIYYHQMSDIKNVNDFKKLDLVYINDDVRLPSTLKKLQDGTLILMLSKDICKQFVQKNCCCCFPSLNKTIIVRERRSDEIIPQLSFINKQQNDKKSIINWFFENLAKTSNLIPNLALYDESITTNQEYKNINEKLNTKSNMNQISKEPTEISNKITSKNKEIYTVSEYRNKQIEPNNVQNENMGKFVFSTVNNQLNKNSTDSTELINDYSKNWNDNTNYEINYDQLKVKLKNDTNEIIQSNENITNWKDNKKFKKMTYQNKNNEYRTFQTTFDYHINNPIFYKLEQPQNRRNSVNSGPPYKYQRYADEDVIVSRRIRTLKNVLHFMKDLVIN